MKKTPKHTIIVSLDAVGETDKEYMLSLPNFKRFFSDGAYSFKVNSMYPSITYPCHASIITGMYPKNHKVINNVKFQPHRKSPDWNWYRKDIKAITLYDIAKKNGMKTASFLWPVTAKSKNLDYHIPEIFSNRWWDNQIFTSLRNGSRLLQFKMFLKYGKLLDGIKQPALDNFTFSAALHTIKRYKPNLVLMHLTDVDTIKHYRNSLEDTKKALLRHDERLGSLIEVLKEIGIYEDTTLILLGDHSQLRADYIVYLNTFFKEKGWLYYDNDNDIIKDYKVISYDCDGSAYIYIKEKYRDRITPIVKSFLEKIKETNIYGIEKIYTKEEAIQRGADSNCDFMIEAKEGYYFQNSAKQRIYKINKVEDEDKLMLATHGYEPTKKNYHTFIGINGVGIKPGELLREIQLIDEAPTIASIMGLSMPNVDGSIIKEFLEDCNE